jgi:hypothetical protein
MQENFQVGLAFQQGLKVGGAEAMPSCAASCALFANAPAGCVGATLTIRGTAAKYLTMSFDGNAATVGTLGHDYVIPANLGANGSLTIDIPALCANLKTARAIESATTITGYITYWVKS